MLATAPDAIVDVVILADESKALVGVVPVEATSVVTLAQRKAPVLDVDVLASCIFCSMELLFGDRDRRTIKIRSNDSASEGQKRWRKISVRGDNVADLSFGHAWTTDNQRYINVFFVATFLSGLKTMLADMIAIVAAVEYISIFEYSCFGETVDDTIDYLIDCLQCTEAISIEFIIRFDVFLTLLGQCRDPRYAASLEDGQLHF